MLQLAETEADFRCAGGPEPPGVGTALGEMHRAAEEPGPSLYPQRGASLWDWVPRMECRRPYPIPVVPNPNPPSKLQPRRAASLSSLVLNYLQISRIGMRNGWRWDSPKLWGPGYHQAPPSWLLATIADIKFRFLFCFKPERQQWTSTPPPPPLFITNISYHRIPELTEGTPQCGHSTLWCIAPRVRKQKESISFNLFCSGQNWGLSRSRPYTFQFSVWERWTNDVKLM